MNYHMSTLTVACHMLIICLLIDVSFATLHQSWSPSAVSSSPRATLQVLHHHQSSNGIDESSSYWNDKQVSGLSFLQHRARFISSASCNAIGCPGGDTQRTDRYDVSSYLENTINKPSANTSLLLDSILSISRGGASASYSSNNNNVVQSIIKSILEIQSLPSPIKQLIELICQFIESITGFKVLPEVQLKKKTSKAKKKSKPREEQVLVEEVSMGSTKKKRRSSSEMNVDEVKMASSSSVGQRKKKKQKSLETEESTDDEPQKAKVTSSADEKTSDTSTTTASATPLKDTKPKRPDAASKKFLSTNMKSSNPNYRIQRELKEFLSSPPPGLSVKISGKNVRLWIVTLTMPDTSIYAGDIYKLRISFPNDYPTSPPSVYFLPPTPRHEHVYTNGDICLSLLGKDWRPIMTASSIAGSIMSILCGAQRKSLPMDNARHAGNKPGKKQDDWVYHDDNC